MKTFISVFTASLLTAQFSFAACQDDSMATAARKLRLSGEVTLVDKDLNGKPTGGIETDYVKRLSSKSEEFKAVKSMVEEKNGEMLSAVFGIEKDGSVAVVIRNKNTCEISIFGTDGEEGGTLKIVENGIKSNSISFYSVVGELITTITKVKKSKILQN